MDKLQRRRMARVGLLVKTCRANDQRRPAASGSRRTTWAGATAGAAMHVTLLLVIFGLQWQVKRDEPVAVGTVVIAAETMKPAASAAAAEAGCETKPKPQPKAEPEPNRTW